MKTLLSATAAIALLAASGPVSAQMYQPENPAMAPQPYQSMRTETRTYQPAEMYRPAEPYQPTETYQRTETYRSSPAGYPSMRGPVQPMERPTYTSGAMGAPIWMMDDGSSSDHPIHNPGDISGDRLNAQYSGGLTTAPGTGLPALPGQ